MIKGIDISHHNVINNWDAVAKSVDFIVIRAGYGEKENRDRKFNEYIEQIVDRKIPVMFYWFVYAKNVNSAIKNAYAFCNTIFPYIDVKKFTPYSTRYWCDFEYDSESGAKLLSVQERSEIIECFCDAVEDNLNNDCGCYLNRDYAFSKVTIDVVNKPLWYARYGQVPDSCISEKPNFKLWQFSSTGKVEGVKGNVDLNVVPDEKYIPTRGVLKRGESGEVVKNLQRQLNYMVDANLVDDGKFGSKTQGWVMNFQRINKLKPDGIVGFNTFEKLYLQF